MPHPVSLAGRAVDAALELSIVASFSRIGIVARRRLFDWTAPPAGALRRRTALA